MEIVWTGKSGAKYTYSVFPRDPSATNWADTAGNYIFAKQSGSTWKAIYIGETGSFKTRLTNSHEKLPCARNYGYTHIHAHRNGGGLAARNKEEDDLIKNYNPPCND